MKYKWIEENELVLNTETNTTIPMGNGTAAAREFAAWLADGNTPDAADPEVEQIKYIPCKDIIERLEALGKYTTVKAAMSEFQRDIFFSLREGIASNDADVIALLTACGIDYTQVLY